jgi:hypothetical protein
MMATRETRRVNKQANLREIYESLLARLIDHQAGGLYRSQIGAVYGHCDHFIADERGFAPTCWAISMITSRTATAAA